MMHSKGVSSQVEGLHLRERGAAEEPAGFAPNLGVHLAERLFEVGCRDVFAVPGDFNMLLLDQLASVKQLNMVYTCNELNAGYAADGYARKTGVGALVVTFNVGGLSAINAVSGAFAEDLPVIIVSGAPNSNDYGANHALHHTSGVAGDLGQQMRAYREFTCAQVCVRFIEEAQKQIDWAISQALLHSKPAYIEVACNLADLSHPTFQRTPVPYALRPPHTNKASLEAAVQAAAAMLNPATKPVLLAGARLRPADARAAFLQLADASHYAVAVMPDAKGFVPDTYPRMMGTYWAAASSPCCCELVESADVVVTAGCVWNDVSTCGWSELLQPAKVIAVDPDRVTVAGGLTFGCIHAPHFLAALAAALKPNPTSAEMFGRMVQPLKLPDMQPPGERLRTNVLYSLVQRHLEAHPATAVLTETGDSMFNTQKLRLPAEAEYEMQLRYGSIGWSVGATLGYALAAARAHPPKRVMAFIGDGSFQMTAQEASTMIRAKVNPIIVLVNNQGYTIETEIHQGEYNCIQEWDYTGVVRAMANGAGKLHTARVTDAPDFEKALKEAASLPDHFVFIEAVIHRDDCSRELLEWGCRLAASNKRAPVRA